MTLPMSVCVRFCDNFALPSSVSNGSRYQTMPEQKLLQPSPAAGGHLTRAPGGQIALLLADSRVR
jgi:hypothetical protein